jgi:hypothetical protein
MGGSCLQPHRGLPAHKCTHTQLLVCMECVCMLQRQWCQAHAVLYAKCSSRTEQGGAF